MTDRVGVSRASGGETEYPMAPSTMPMDASVTSATVGGSDTQTASTSQGFVTPAICFSVCSNAYTYAQWVGNVDELCADGGTFIKALNNCINCIAANQGDSDNSLPIELRKVVGICVGGMAFTTDTFLMRDGSTSTITHLVNVSSTSSNTKSDTPSTTFQSESSTSASATYSANASEIGSKAWIAGPVVGAVAGLSLAIFAAIWVWRRRSRRLNPVPGEEEEHYDKAQLHSDCIPKPMFEAADGAIHEMQGSSPQQAAPEKPSNEPPCQELPGDETRPRPDMSDTTTVV